MTQEEKAAAYDKALQRAKNLRKDAINMEENLLAKQCEIIFPELVEPEDSRIRKEIRDFICWATDRGCITKEQVEKSNSWLAWLEKQASPVLSNSSNIGKNEQQPFDYEHANIQQKDFALKAEPKFKIGDTVKDPFGGVYHIIEINNDSYKTDDGRFILFENESAYTNFTPAWSENQTSPVLSNSSNAGKNEQTLPDIEEAIKKVEEKAKAFTEAHKGESSDDILAQMRGEQKPAWSEEDEEHIESILKRLDGMCKKGATFTETCFAVNQDMDWLKSLKDRVQPQDHWKPTKIQMELLKEAADKRWEPDGSDPLYQLYEHLRKL